MPLFFRDTPVIRSQRSEKRVSIKGKVRSSWQSEEVKMQRKECSGHSSSSFNLCSSRETGGKRTRRAGEPVIRGREVYTFSPLPFTSFTKELLL